MDFLEQKSIILNDISKFILEEIKTICKSKPCQESCGIIFKENNRLSLLECSNLSQDVSSSFLIDPVFFIEYNVEYVFHSHCIGSASPSACDMKCSNELCIPFLIYSLRDDNFYLYENIGV